jgi:hypothetical protein
MKNIFRETLSDTSKLGLTCFKEQNLCRLPNLEQTKKLLNRAGSQNLKEHVYTKNLIAQKTFFLHRPKRLFWRLITSRA